MLFKEQSHTHTHISVFLSYYTIIGKVCARSGREYFFLEFFILISFIEKILAIVVIAIIHDCLISIVKQQILRKKTRMSK